LRSDPALFDLARVVTEIQVLPTQVCYSQFLFGWWSSFFFCSSHPIICFGRKVRARPSWPGHTGTAWQQLPFLVSSHLVLFFLHPLHSSFSASSSLLDCFFISVVPIILHSPEVFTQIWHRGPTTELRGRLTLFRHIYSERRRKIPITSSLAESFLLVQNSSHHVDLTAHRSTTCSVQCGNVGKYNQHLVAAAVESNLYQRLSSTLQNSPPVPRQPAAAYSQSVDSSYPVGGRVHSTLRELPEGRPF
jgi:hypothetical protein